VIPIDIEKLLARVDELFEENGYALDSTQATCIETAVVEAWNGQ